MVAMTATAAVLLRVEPRPGVAARCRPDIVLPRVLLGTSPDPHWWARWEG